MGRIGGSIAPSTDLSVAIQNHACWADPGSVSIGSGYVLHATGLPTDKALNISISNAEGEAVYPFGMSITGTEAFQETASVRGTTTYTFMGEIRGNTRIYGMCSVEVV